MKRKRHGMPDTASRTQHAGCRTATARRRGFVLMEVVTALGLLAVTLVGVYAGVQVNESMLRHYVAQRRAIEVLDNLVERMAVAAPVSPAHCATVLDDEVARSPLSGRPGLRSECAQTAEGAVRCAVWDGTHLLAEVRIGHREK